jgi:hypothetical protein
MDMVHHTWLLGRRRAPACMVCRRPWGDHECYCGRPWKDHAPGYKGEEACQSVRELTEITTCSHCGLGFAEFPCWRAFPSSVAVELSDPADTDPDTDPDTRFSDSIFLCAACLS